MLASYNLNYLESSYVWSTVLLNSGVALASDNSCVLEPCDAIKVWSLGSWAEAVILRSFCVLCTLVL